MRPCLHHHMLFGRVSRKILLNHPKTNSSKFSCQTQLELQMALSSMVRWNWKNCFLAANPPDEFSENRDKRYPMSTVKYTAGSLMLWACFSARGPELLVQMHGIMDSIKHQQIQNQNLTASVRNLITGHVCIFQQDNNPQQTQNESLSTKWIFYHGGPCPLTWTLQKMSEVNWREEAPSWSCESEGSGEILYEENGLLSLISCSPNSSGIIEENLELLTWKKDVAIIGCQ